MEWYFFSAKRVLILPQSSTLPIRCQDDDEIYQNLGYWGERPGHQYQYCHESNFVLFNVTTKLKSDWCCRVSWNQETGSVTNGAQYVTQIGLSDLLRHKTTQ